MIQYTFNIDQANQQYLNISVHLETPKDETTIRIPAWRPGRYELGNFAKNIKGFKVVDQDNEVLKSSKFTKDGWKVDTSSATSIRIDYAYYAAELNAGSTFLNQEQLYVNPVNCCVFDPEQVEEPISLVLSLPSDWQYAGAMPNHNGVLTATNFDELADSPFMCSATLQHRTYELAQTTFYVWFNGEVQPDWDRLLADFKKFTASQIEKFTEFPSDTYHFLIQILPTRAYHGVEHCKSTVITLGPSYDVFGLLYKELLGISSHELYHTWNVKAIRPIEMYPYDFTRENYSELGYICEGVTTYMGDLFLMKSGVFTLQQYLNEFNAQLQKHFDNPARLNYSVAQSSFDTWLDGYTPGVPGRKVSIYTEGCLLAFVTDVMIIRATQHQFGLDEVMKRLYLDFAKQGKGVSRNDYKKTLEAVSGLDFTSFFEQYIEGHESYLPILEDTFAYLGFSMLQEPVKSFAAGSLGMKTVTTNQHVVVSNYLAGSCADLAGIQIGDEVLAVNHYMIQGELDKWLTYFAHEPKHLSIVRAGKLIELKLPDATGIHYNEYSLQLLDHPTEGQQAALTCWKG